MGELIKESFSIEGIEPFTGYYNPQRDWNGWDCPLFEWDEAVRIAHWINEWKGQDELRVDFDRKVIIAAEDPDAPFDINSETAKTEDGEKELYPVGTGWWIWSVHESEAAEP